MAWSRYKTNNKTEKKMRKCKDKEVEIQKKNGKKVENKNKKC